MNQISTGIGRIAEAASEVSSASKSVTERTSYGTDKMQAAIHMVERANTSVHSP